MRRAVLAATALCAAAFLFATPANAASFDCARAQSADEVTICRNPRLSELDSEMGGLWYAYSRVPMLMGGNGDRGDEAREFLVRRRACGRDIACLTALYRARIEALHRGIDDSMRDYARFVTG